MYRETESCTWEHGIGEWRFGAWHVFVMAEASVRYGHSDIWHCKDEFTAIVVLPCVSADINRSFGAGLSGIRCPKRVILVLRDIMLFDSRHDGAPATTERSRVLSR